MVLHDEKNDVPDVFGVRTGRKCRILRINVYLWLEKMKKNGYFSVYLLEYK